MKILSKLEFRKIKSKEFDDATQILDNELGKKRVRSSKFLYQKFKEFPKFFLGIFLDNELIGVIFGFPREDYLLMSELAIDRRFQRRGFGKLLVKEFEKVAKENKYYKINVGSEDKSIYFYKSLLGYKPFLLIQFEKWDYFEEDFNKFKIIRIYNYNKNNTAIEVKITNCNLKLINQLRKKYSKAYFQYIFTKRIRR